MLTIFDLFVWEINELYTIHLYDILLLTLDQQGYHIYVLVVGMINN